MTQRSIRTLALAAAVGTTLWLAPVASAHVELEATLDDDQETPAPNVGVHTPTGTANFIFDFATKTIQYEITADDLTGAQLAVHIHQGVAGVAGGVLGCCTLSTSLSGTTQALTDADITALFTEGLYVNIHTAANAINGELRGQITLADGQCDCDGTRKDFTKCVQDAIKGLDKADKKSAEVKALKKAVKRSFCGKSKKPKKAIGCCLPLNPVENIVTGKICAAVPEKKCTNFGGTSKGEGSDCAEPFCSPSGAFIDDSDLF
jgi:hypothetical protein